LLSLITILKQTDANLIFSSVCRLVGTTLNLWSPEVTSIIQLLSPTSETLAEQCYDAVCLVQPSTADDFKTLFASFVAVVEPKLLKQEYFNCIVACSFGPGKSSLQVEYFYESLPDASQSKMTKLAVQQLNEQYGLSLKTNKNGTFSELDFPAIKLQINLRKVSDVKEAKKVVAKALKESFEEFERTHGWPLTNCSTQLQMAKFGKHTLDVPNILASYFERVLSEEKIPFDRAAFAEGLMEKVLMI
jgi:hypothetical protein